MVGISTKSRAMCVQRCGSLKLLHLHLSLVQARLTISMAETFAIPYHNICSADFKSCKRWVSTNGNPLELDLKSYSLNPKGWLHHQCIMKNERNVQFCIRPERRVLNECESSNARDALKISCVRSFLPFLPLLLFLPLHMLRFVFPEFSVLLHKFLPL